MLGQYDFCISESDLASEHIRKLEDAGYLPRDERISRNLEPENVLRIMEVLNAPKVQKV